MLIDIDHANSSNHTPLFDISESMGQPAFIDAEGNTRITYFMDPVAGVDSRLNSATGTPLAASMGANPAAG